MGVRVPADLVIGFEEIDRQHRGIFEEIAVASEAVAARDLVAARASVGRLGDLLVGHFATEEAYMAETLYPDRSRHKSAHDLFMQDFAQLGRELAEKGLGDLVVQWISTRLPEWVKFHVKVNDAPLGQYLVAKRFRPRPASAGSFLKPQAS